jgi:hypothetical protein
MDIVLFRVWLLQFWKTYRLHPQSVIHFCSVDGGSVFPSSSVVANKTRYIVIQKLIIKKCYLSFYLRQYESRIVSWNSQQATVCPVM